MNQIHKKKKKLKNLFGITKRLLLFIINVCVCVCVRCLIVAHNVAFLSMCSLEYIQTIMMMEESVQHVVMTAIQEVNDHAV